jgi:two-component system, LuxR family, response regulator FixJ
MTQDPVVFVLDPENNDRLYIDKQLDEVNLEHQSFANIDAFFSAFDHHRLGCVLTELKLGHATAFQLVKRLRQLNSSIPVILLTAHATVPLAVQAFKAGLFDVLEKPSEAFQLWESATRAFESHGRHLDEARQRDAVKYRMMHLSRQELEVLQMLLDGEPNKRIAARLGLSPRTIVFRRKSLMDKMNAKSVAELASLIHLVTSRVQHNEGGQPTSLLDFHLAANVFNTLGKVTTTNNDHMTNENDQTVVLPGTQER